MDNFASGKYEKDTKLPLNSAQQQENEQLRREFVKVTMESGVAKVGYSSPSWSIGLAGR